MESTSVTELLTHLLEITNLKDYLEIFKQNCIDDDLLLLLDDEGLKQLMPLVGHRMKFKAALKELKNQSDSLLNLGSVGGLDSLPSSLGEDTCTSFVENHRNVESPQTALPITEKNSTSDGRAILAEGKSNNGLLKETHRKRLSQLVICNLLENNSTRVITTLEFKSLAAEIQRLFPKESSVVYYSAYEASTNNKSYKKNASGKLYETYISRRRKLRSRGELPGTSRSSSASSKSSTYTLTPVEDTSDEPCQEKLIWLNNSVDPWQMVESYWTDTAETRLQILCKHGGGSIAEYFQRYPALKQPLGYTLLFLDFNHLYADKNEGLFSNIVIHREKIITIAQDKLRNTRDRDIKESITNLISLTKDSQSEASTNAALLLLPYVIGTSQTVKRGKQHWRPSRAEIRDGFVTHASSVADISSVIERRREKLQRLGKTLQPFIIYVGDTPTEVQSAYVIVDNTRYYFPKLVTAVDAAFKIFHATGACYPEESTDIWLVIQVGLYKIKTIFDKPNQATNSLLTDLELLDE